MMESQGEQASGADSDSPKTPSRRAKSRSKVWQRVFKRHHRSSDNVGEASGSSAVTSPRVSGNSEGAVSSVDGVEVDFSPETSTSSCSPVYCRSLYGSTSSSDLDVFDSVATDSGHVKRSKLYPNSEIDEQNCLRPSVARALFLQLESWLVRKDGTGMGKGTGKSLWKKKKNSCGSESGDSDDELGGMTRTVSMPGGIQRRSKCHCAACCSCSPRDRLEGICSASIKPSTFTSSLDTGLATLGFSKAYNPLIQKPLNLSLESDTDGSNTCLAKTSPVPPSRFHSLPNHGSVDKHKTCLVCGKLILPNHISATVFDRTINDLPSTSTTVPQPMLPALDLCLCHHKQIPVRSDPEHSPCQVTIESTDDEACVPESTYDSQPKVGPTEFKERVDNIKKWFAEFSDEQKNLVLKQLLDECDLPQLHLLSLEMEPRLHANCPPNCHDRLRWLPHALTLYILEYLDPVSLSRSSAVCRSWYHLTNEPSLWKKFCGQAKWRLSHAGERKQLLHHMMPDGTIQWKNVFAERYRLGNNWLRGRCNVRTFEGHTQGISCVQFDDTRIVSGSSDKTIKVWNIRTNNPWAVQTLAGHSGTVRCLHLDGNRLVSGSTDRCIKVWDLSTQQSWSSIACKVTMVGHTDTVRCLQVDADKVISGSYDKTLKVWDIKTGQCRMTLRGHSAAVLCVQFDVTKIVSGSCDKTIKVWTFDGECKMTLEGHHDAVTCLQFDSSRIFSGSLDCNLKFWDIHTGQCMNTIDWKASEGHTGVVRCLQADSWRVLSASDDRTLKVWNLETGQRLVTLRNHTDGVTCLQFNDSIIVSGSYDKTVKLWDFSCC